MRRSFFRQKAAAMDLLLDKKIALVSGSTAGIGNAIATTLAREGATVIINGRTQKAVDEALAKMKAATSGDVLGFAGDLSQAASADALFARHPKLDIS
jgi:NAD(P)-dependent dehydrogenase (short-subunit alcohol dehydrogenase family)